jgi:SAM-dependent methyltransferase
MNQSTLESKSAPVKDGVGQLSAQNLSCPVCAAEVDATFRLLTTNPDSEVLSVADNPFAELEFNGCRQCGFGWGTPYVDSESLAKFYRDMYYQKVKRRRSDPNPKFPPFVPLESRSVSQVLLARMFKSFRAGDSVLEIGPGHGRSFRTLSQLIPGLKYFAFEPDSTFSELLQRFLNVQVFPYRFPSEPVVSAMVEGRKFDLVLMSHVLEHFNGKDVGAVLQNVHDLLADGGILVCEVPHSDWREGEEAVGNDITHLSFFGRESLRTALIKAGFKVEFLNTCSEDYETWRNELSSAASETPGRANSSPIAWGRRIAEALPTSLQRRLLPRLYSLMNPNQSVRLLSSHDFDYGGDRTCLRALATIAEASPTQ